MGPSRKKKLSLNFCDVTVVAARRTVVEFDFMRMLEHYWRNIIRYCGGIYRRSKAEGVREGRGLHDEELRGVSYRTCQWSDQIGEDETGWCM